MRSVHIVNLPSSKGNKHLIYERVISKDDEQFTCKITREAPRKDRPAKDAILFLKPYQLIPVVIRTEGRTGSSKRSKHNLQGAIFDFNLQQEKEKITCFYKCLKYLKMLIWPMHSACKRNSIKNRKKRNQGINPRFLLLLVRTKRPFQL